MRDTERNLCFGSILSFMAGNIELSTIKFERVTFPQFTKTTEVLYTHHELQPHFTSPFIQDNVIKKTSGDNILTYNEEEHMSDFTKTELESLLKVNKSEVDVAVATVKKDIAEWREQQNTQMANLNATIQAMSSKIDGKLEAVEGKIDGIKTSITTIKWTTSIGLTLVTIIMSAVVLVSSWIMSGKIVSSPLQPAATHSQPAESAKK
ncbi:hypothetical protein [Xenorhabdus lircayensis]|uniref:Uncharacterized protein n=1 Tax=Xenorhabdus lircayensis TaxID=2763499 RepID=A0ABS0U3B9_9GAMM|nr:hypothetical protein [Xenorhabdus lircayensis]MBI6547281.1 hypothetical protein [Xenorhabdus lircayensis]